MNTNIGGEFPYGSKYNDSIHYRILIQKYSFIRMLDSFDCIISNIERSILSVPDSKDLDQIRIMIDAIVNSFRIIKESYINLAEKLNDVDNYIFSRTNTLSIQELIGFKGTKILYYFGEGLRISNEINNIQKCLNELSRLIEFYSILNLSSDLKSNLSFTITQTNDYLGGLKNPVGFIIRKIAKLIFTYKELKKIVSQIFKDKKIQTYKFSSKKLFLSSHVDKQRKIIKYLGQYNRIGFFSFFKKYFGFSTLISNGVPFTEIKIDSLELGNHIKLNKREFTDSLSGNNNDFANEMLDSINNDNIFACFPSTTNQDKGKLSANEYRQQHEAMKHLSTNFFIDYRTTEIFGIGWNYSELRNGGDKRYLDTDVFNRIFLNGIELSRINGYIQLSSLISDTSYHINTIKFRFYVHAGREEIIDYLIFGKQINFGFQIRCERNGKGGMIDTDFSCVFLLSLEGDLLNIQDNKKIILGQMRDKEFFSFLGDMVRQEFQKNHCTNLYDLIPIKNLSDLPDNDIFHDIRTWKNHESLIDGLNFGNLNDGWLYDMEGPKLFGSIINSKGYSEARNMELSILKDNCLQFRSILGDYFIDIGCGDGTKAVEIISIIGKPGLEYIGVDISRKMVISAYKYVKKSLGRYGSYYNNGVKGHPNHIILHLLKENFCAKIKETLKYLLLSRIFGKKTEDDINIKVDPDKLVVAEKLANLKEYHNKSLFLPGFTFGNLNKKEQAVFLKNLSDNIMTEDDHLFLSVFMEQDEETIRRLYENKEGMAFVFAFFRGLGIKDRNMRYIVEYGEDRIVRIGVEFINDVEIKIGNSFISKKKGQKVYISRSQRFSRECIKKICMEGGFFLDKEFIQNGYGWFILKKKI